MRSRTSQLSSRRLTAHFRNARGQTQTTLEATHRGYTEQFAMRHPSNRPSERKAGPGFLDITIAGAVILFPTFAEILYIPRPTSSPSAAARGSLRYSLAVR